LLFPAVIIQTSDLSVCDTTFRVGASAVEPAMGVFMVVIILEKKQFPLQITGLIRPPSWLLLLYPDQK